MIYDLHNDLLTSGLSVGEIRRYLDANSKTVITLAYWTSREVNPTEALQKHIQSYKGYENVRFAVEDIGFLTDGDLDFFTTLPLLYCTLAWKDENGVAGGHNSDGGVTDRGARFIGRLADKNIVIDTAHINERSFNDVTELTDKIINSHCCLSSVNRHTRNATDRQIREIISRGGIVGLTAVDDFFGAEKGINGFKKQIDTFVQKFGCESLAIGTDFFGAAPISGLSCYDDFNNLTYMLQSLGYTYSDIDKIFCQNAALYFKKYGK